MKLRLTFTVFITFVAVFCAVKSSPRSYTEKVSNSFKKSSDADNFVLIGGSSSEKIKPKIEDEKLYRSGHYYSLLPVAVAPSKPNADYYAHPNGYPSHHPNPAGGLLNANVQLLEPFMLITFLLFVLCLVDKARSFPVPLSRIDRDYQLYEGYSNYIKRNQTDF